MNKIENLQSIIDQPEELKGSLEYLQCEEEESCENLENAVSGMEDIISRIKEFEKDCKNLVDAVSNLENMIKEAKELGKNHCAN